MKVFAWLLGLLLGIPALFLVTMYATSELGGEVVTLDRTEANGDISKVRVWIVDSEDTSWIEHGEAESPWISGLSDSPTLVLARGGRTSTYSAAADPDAHEHYHRLRREKYGAADQIIDALLGSAEDCQGVPVRLQVVD